jgi:nucleoside-diphosphate-sugar epimerase
VAVGGSLLASTVGAVPRSAYLFPDEQIIVNMGANPLTLYPPTSAQINAKGTNNGLSVPVANVARCLYASSAQYYCTIVALP